MHFSDKSTRSKLLQRPARKCVHLPNPGAISKIVSVGTNAWIRGRIVPYHCMSVQPHCIDHSSPACIHSYFLSQNKAFCSTVGTVFSLHSDYNSSTKYLTIR